MKKCQHKCGLKDEELNMSGCKFDGVAKCCMRRKLLVPTIRLSSGLNMPVLGFGTAGLKSYQCVTAIHNAIDAGFRHFDTAFYYENEREVGQAIRTQISMGNITRDDIFLVNKLWNIHHEPKEVCRICQKQLALMGLEYFDLYLMHFPVGYRHICDEILDPLIGEQVQLNAVDYVDTWRAMEKLVSAGLVRSIGVSNFNAEQIQRVIVNCQLKPVVNQIEIWPGFMQPDLVNYCRYNGIVVTAYAPLGQPNRKEHDPIYFFSIKMNQLCKKYSKKPAQIVLRYLVDSGVVPIPKSANPVHMNQNINIFDFELDDGDMEAFRKIKLKKRKVQFNQVKEQKHPFYPFESDPEDEGEDEADWGNKKTK